MSAPNMRRLCTMFKPRRLYCVTCCDLHHSNGKVDRYGSFEHETFFSALSDSADAGCVSCTFLRDGAQDLLGERDLGKVRIRTVREFGEREHEDGVDRNPFRTWMDVKDARDKSIMLEFYSDDEEVLRTWPVLSAGTHISADPASEECLGKAREWLRQCSKNHHETCGSAQAKNPLPTRVIDVGSPTQDPRLYESRPMETGSYAALSYCWGKSRTFITTLSTFDARKAGFQLEDLPKTCRDAVVVARALGIQYIWIDSLCIVQDSSSDWEAEAAKMCAVYTNAVITFAGIDSPDSDTGLFVSEPDRHTVALPVRLSNDGRLANVYARKMNSSYKSGFLHAKHVPASDPSSNGILNSRGWTLQEVILSRRLLCFSSWELGWCCRSRTACECDPLFRSDQLFRLKQFIEIPMTLSALLAEDAKEERLYIWMRIVVRFTSRQLSFQADRLPAIAGLADAMHGHIGGRYLAGMWEESMEKMVMWHSDKKPNGQEPAELRRSVEDDYAPSWSWASVRGGVYFAISGGHLRYTSLCNIVAIDYSPSTTNVYGPGRGTLTLEGLVLPLRLDEDQERLMWHEDTQSMCFGGTESTWWYPDRRPKYTAGDSLIGKRLYAIFIGGGVGTGTSKGEPVTGYIVLVLRKVTDLDYRRVGYVWMVVIDNEVKRWWRGWEEKAHGKTIPIV